MGDMILTTLTPFVIIGIGACLYAGLLSYERRRSQVARRKGAGGLAKPPIAR